METTTTYLSECCGTPPLNGIMDTTRHNGAVTLTGRCSKCKENAVFTVVEEEQ